MSAPQIHFVVSAPRSGSTWLAKALNHHPQIFATEHRLFGNFFEVWPNNNGRPAPRITLDAYARAFSVHYFHQHVADNREQFVDDFISEYSSFLLDFAKRKTGKSIIIDKITPYPGTSRTVIDRIKKFFPQSMVIQLVRDGRDVAVSGVFDWLLKDSTDAPRYRYFVERENSEPIQRFYDDDVLTRWAENWKETVQIFRNHPSDLRITFESMLENQSGPLRQLFEVLDVDATEDLALNCAEQETFSTTTGRENGQMDPTSKQRSGVAGDWRHFMTDSDARLFDKIAGKQLVNEGYEADTNWISTLPEKLKLNSAQAIE